MTPEQIAIVKSSFEKVEPIAEAAAGLFYGRLFEIAPEVKPLFADSDMDTQGHKLMTMIGIAVRGLDKLEAIVPAVKDLGKRHVGYGVKEEHFAPVGSALLWTLEQGLGEHWNAEAEQAWATVYGVLADTMIAGMNE
ncbi:MAG: globin family protein [Pseudomonadota bacterium]|nr:globin family protein [Pseudomonadota bacterium]